MIHDKSLLEYMVPLGLCKDDVRAGTGGTKALFHHSSAACTSSWGRWLAEAHAVRLGPANLFSEIATRQYMY